MKGGGSPIKPLTYYCSRSLPDRKRGAPAGVGVVRSLLNQARWRSLTCSPPRAFSIQLDDHLRSFRSSRGTSLPH